MERAIQDLGVGITFLRSRGYDRVILIGNSGGAALVAFYQQQAERLTIDTTPDGRAIHLASRDLPQADAIALLGAHVGRARTLTEMLDPSVVDESDPTGIAADLDMFDPRNGPPYDRQFLSRYRAAQRDRNDRLTDRALSQLRRLSGDDNPDADQAMLTHRTVADPRYLDLTLDPNERKIGSIWGDAKRVNSAANGPAQFGTLRSFLSQWSLRCSRADGPACLAATSVPVLNMEYAADQIVFPSHIAEWSRAASGRCTEHRVAAAPHYPQSDPGLVAHIADTLIAWGDALRGA